MKQTILYFLVIIIAGGSGFALHRYLDTQKQNNNAVIGYQRPEFSALDLNERVRNISEWDGKVIFINFWATWCPPCMKEIPDFIELQKTYGDQDFQIIGIAIDNREAVTKFASEAGMNYPIMVAEADGITLARKYGNDSGGLPYTVIIDRSGDISDTITGELSKKHAIKILQQHGIN